MKMVLQETSLFVACVLVFLTCCITPSITQIRFTNTGSRFPNRHFGASPRPRPINVDRTPTISTTGEVNACNCLPKGSCPRGKGQARHECFTEQKEIGICCNVQSAGQVTTRAGLGGNTSPVNVPSNVVQAGINAGQEVSTRIAVRNRELVRQRRFLPKGSAARGHAYFFQRDPAAVAQHVQAYALARSSAEIAKMENLSPAQASPSLQGVDTRSVTTRTRCAADERIQCDATSPFRTIDGSCNNLLKPLLGRSITAFGRLAPATYDDGVMSPRTLSVDRSELRNVRTISNTVLLDINHPSPAITLNVMQWAQFIDHDFSLSPFEDLDGEAIMCCENGRVIRNAHEQCFPILVSPTDGFFRQFQEQCINFVRSMLALRPGCSLGPAEQVNVLTHWVDGSMVYGSTEEGARAVRNEGTPFLKVSRNNLLPVDPEVDCEARIPAPCFVAGDSRSNEQPGLTVLHIILVREHNRLAGELVKLRPGDSPDDIFEEARRIVIAEIQHITYTEWLPLIVGPEIMKKYRLYGPTIYRPDDNSDISNEFATAAFRFGHSLVQGVFLLPSRTGRITTKRLRETFNDPSIFQKEPELVESFVRSLVLQPSQNLDNFITEELSNHLFEARGSGFGMDLMSLNMQRGREHGISTYADMRRLFNIGQTRSFADLKSTTPISLVERLQSVYSFVDDIDLWAGGMTEKSVPNGLLGPTFANLVGQQFSRLRTGDRFFYDVQGQAGSFTAAQIRELKKSSMSKMFCDNSNIQEIQPNAFIQVDRRNQKTSCNRLPEINLKLFS